MPSVKDKRSSEFRTICAVHREIYDILMGDKIETSIANAIIERLEEAYNMAKKMNNKLRQYKHNYDDGWWEENKKQKEVLGRKNQ